MTVFRFLRRQAAAWLLPVLALGLSTGCGGKKSNSTATTASTVTIKGKVTYVRRPLLKSPAGIPTGLETDTAKFQTLPARGVVVRAWESKSQKLSDGTTQNVWVVVNNAVTDAEGSYSFGLTKGNTFFLELLSRQPVSLGSGIRIVADQIASAVNIVDRPLYTLRKGLDGASATLTPGTAATADATVDFAVGLNDNWLLGYEQNTRVLDAAAESAGTGSRPLAILDSAFGFAVTYGRASVAVPLDLHYQVGVSDPKGSFIEYDQTVYPQSVDGFMALRHIFGSVKGAASDDDAFDEGVLFPLFARNGLSLTASGFHPVATMVPDLSPDLAVLEAFADAMAANQLKSPYLADTHAGGANYRDVRDVMGLTGAQLTPFAVPALRALSWDIVLKANNLPNPGTVTDWDKITPATSLRFFTPSATLDSSNRTSDVTNIFHQVGRLQEARTATETADLAAIFTNAVLTPMLATYNLTWPRPAVPALYGTFLQDWGTDPKSTVAALPTQTFSMAKAVQVNGTYPNLSSGEVVFARYLLTKDTAFLMSLNLPAPLPAGTQIAVVLNRTTYHFDNANTPIRLTQSGNATSPALYTLSMRLLSPTTLQAGPIQAALRLDPAP